MRVLSAGLAHRNTGAIPASPLVGFHTGVALADECPVIGIASDDWDLDQLHVSQLVTGAILVELRIA